MQYYTLTPSDQMEVATHIKAIAVADTSFDARHGDEIARLLETFPAVAAGLRFRKRHPKESASVEDTVPAADLICGPYVVTKLAAGAFDVREARDAAAVFHEGEVLRLELKRGHWEASLNEPIIWRLWPFRICVGARFKLWKRSGPTDFKPKRRTIRSEMERKKKKSR